MAENAYKYIQNISSVVIVLGSSHHYCEEKRRETKSTSRNWEQALVSTLVKLPGGDSIEVFAMIHNPKASFSVPEYLARKSYFSKGIFTKNCNFSGESEILEDVIRQTEAVASRFKQVMVVNLKDHICPDKKCSSEKDGLVIYFDNNHISGGIGKFLSERLKNYLQAIWFEYLMAAQLRGASKKPSGQAFAVDKGVYFRC